MDLIVLVLIAAAFGLSRVLIAGIERLMEK